MDDDDLDCHRVGIRGNCGPTCPVLLRGDCETEEEMLADVEPDNPYEDFDRAMEIL